MKKIFIYSGSGNENSSLNLFINNLIERVNQISNEKIEIDLYTAFNTNIKNSTGCKNCFNYGVCTIDTADHLDTMSEMKRSMLNADYIIFASPVYAHNVSGDMKTFIDRITYWTHLIRLAGKPGTIIASCSTNGMHIVHDYLSKIFNYLGIYTVDKIGLDYNNEITDLQLSGFASNIVAFLKKEKVVTSTNELEAVFQTMKFIYRDYPPQHNEYLYWKNNELFECSSFQEVLERRVLEKNRLMYN